MSLLLLVAAPPASAYARPVPGGFGDPLRRTPWSGWSVRPPSERPAFEFPLDRQPPVIVASVSSLAGPYAMGDLVRVDFACTDSGSGIHSCPSQATLDTSFPGHHSVSFYAADVAGNVGSTAIDYVVVPGRATPMMICPPWGPAWV